jgi:hypothetical protein
MRLERVASSSSLLLLDGLFALTTTSASASASKVIKQLNVAMKPWRGFFMAEFLICLSVLNLRDRRRRIQSSCARSDAVAERSEAQARAGPALQLPRTTPSHHYARITIL